MDFLYDPRTGRCVAWTLRGGIFNANDRKIAATDDTGNVCAVAALNDWGLSCA